MVSTTQWVIGIGAIALVVLGLGLGLGLGLSGGDNEDETTTTMPYISPTTAPDPTTPDNPITTQPITTEPTTPTTVEPEVTTTTPEETTTTPEATTTTPEVTTTQPEPEVPTPVSCLPECELGHANCPPNQVYACTNRGCIYDAETGFCSFGEDYTNYETVVQENENDAEGNTVIYFPPSLFEDSLPLQLKTDTFVSDGAQNMVVPNAARISTSAGTWIAPEDNIVQKTQTSAENNCGSNSVFKVCFEANHDFPNNVVYSANSGEKLIDFTTGPLIAERYYLQQTFSFVGYDKIYGLGEDFHSQMERQQGEVVTVWAQAPNRPGEVGENLYGAHPFLAAVNSQTGKAIGIYIYAVSGGFMEFTFNDNNKVTFRLGSSSGYEMAILPGPTLTDVKKQLFTSEKLRYSTSVYGNPFVDLHVPYWGLGLHIGANYYDQGLNGIDFMVNKMQDANIPFDSVLHGIDHQHQYQSWTINNCKYDCVDGQRNQCLAKDLPDYVANNLQANGYKYQVNVRSTIPTGLDQAAYPYWNLNVANYSVIWDPSRGQPFYGKLWAVDPEKVGEETCNGDPYDMAIKSRVAYYDFFSIQGRIDFQEHLNEFRDQLNFDGVFATELEPVNFDSDSCQDDLPIPYIPKVQGDSLSFNTVCLNADHRRIGQPNPTSHYSWHNDHSLAAVMTLFNGFSQGRSEERPFVTTRTTTIASGLLASHWSGDQDSEDWNQLQLAINNVADMSLFGIGHSGTSACGSTGNPQKDESSQELCLRWQQLSAFMPFSRNYDADLYHDLDIFSSPTPQYPAAFNAAFSREVRDSIIMRYQLLPYYYNLLFRHMQDGDSVFKPMFELYPIDPMTYDVQDQYFLGENLMVVPALNISERNAEGQQVTSRSAYFPKYLRHNVHFNDRYQNHYVRGNENIQDIDIPIDQIGAFVKPQSVIVTHNIDIDNDMRIRNTEDAREVPFKIRVYFQDFLNMDDNRLYGFSDQFFWDDGHSANTFTYKRYTLREFRVSGKNNLQPQYFFENLPVEGHPSNVTHPINEIVFYNVPHDLIMVNVNRSPWPKRFIEFVESPDDEEQVSYVRIFNLKFDITDEFSIELVPAVPSEVSRVNCMPNVKVEDIDGQECERRGCVYEEAVDSHAPRCFYPPGTHFYDETFTLVKDAPQQYYKQAENLIVTPEFKGDVMKLKITDAGSVRYQVNQVVPINFAGESTSDVFQVNMDSTSLNFQVYAGTDRTPSSLIWDSSKVPLVFEDQYISFGSSLASKYLYGLGDTARQNLKLDSYWHTYGIWNRGHPADRDENTYGSETFWINYDDQNDFWYGCYFHNSNAMEIEVTPNPSVIYRTIGGDIELYLIVGTSADDVIAKYSNLVGTSQLPPFWSLGFQLSRYGQNLDELNQALDENLQQGIPVDVQYGDIDYMDQYRDFTVDNVAYQGLKEFVDELQANGRRFIPILDPAISIEHENYAAFENSKNFTDVWVRNSDRTTNFIGKQWPEINGESTDVYWIDFWSEGAQQWWTQEIQNMRTDLFNFDGLWIDMNEPDNLQQPYGDPNQCANNSWNFPKFVPKVVNLDNNQPLYHRTLCLDTVQSAFNFKHYDVHNIYGYSQSQATYQALLADRPEHRPFVLSRSHFAGSQNFAHHWLGDNHATFQDMSYSIVSMIDAGIAGFSFTGADICGHIENSNEDLCRRWTQLGAAYPYSRNHNSAGNERQDPAYYAKSDPSFGEMAKQVTLTRYALLPYLYTLLEKANSQGHPVVRPLFYENTFEQDSLELLEIDDQFYWGNGIMYAPILTPVNSDYGLTRREVYFPEGRFYRLRDPTNDLYEITVQNDWDIITVQENEFPTYLVGGNILPLKDVYKSDGETILSTTELRAQNFDLLIGLSKGNAASGELYWDDGESHNVTDNAIKCLFDADLDAIHFWGCEGTYDNPDELKLSNIYTIGYPSKPSTWNENTYFIYTKNGEEGVIQPEDIEITEQGIGPMGELGEGVGFTSNIRLNLKLEKYNFKVSDMIEIRIKPEHLWKNEVSCIPEYTVQHKDENEQGITAQELCESRGCSYNTRWVNPCVYRENTFGYQNVDEEFEVNNYGTHTSYTLEMDVIDSNSRMFGQAPYDQIFATMDVSRNIRNTDDDSFQLLSFSYTFDRPEPAENTTTASIDDCVEVAGSLQACYSNKAYQNNFVVYDIDDKDQENPLLDFAGSPIIFEQDYTQISMGFAFGSLLYGLDGNDHDRHVRKAGEIIPIWSRGKYNAFTTLYVQTVKGKILAITTHNNRPLEIEILPYTAVTIRISGGGEFNLDVLVGDSFDDVRYKKWGYLKAQIDSKNEFNIQRNMPPFWALGVAVGQEAFKDEAGVAIMAQSMRLNGLPHDTVIHGLDYLDDYQISGVSSKYSNLNDWVNQLNAQDLHYVTGLTPSFANDTIDKLDFDAFVEVDAQRPFVGKQWSESPVAYVDFHDPAGIEYYSQRLESLYNITNSEGYILMGFTPLNLDVNDSIDPNQCEILGDIYPYLPLGISNLSEGTICMTARHYAEDSFNSTDANFEYHFNIHNNYGNEAGKAIHENSPANHRSFVLSDSLSNGAGLGLGSFDSSRNLDEVTFDTLKEELVRVLDLNLNNVAQSGSIPCGATGAVEANEEICTRWTQMAAFFPLMLFYSNDAVDMTRYPSNFGADYINNVTPAITMRYKLLPYLYTNFYQHYVSGQPIVQSVSERYNNIQYANNYEQFMFGQDLMILPQLEPQEFNFPYVLPFESQGWYDFETGRYLIYDNASNDMKLDVDQIGVFMSAGTCVMTQGWNSRKFTNTVDLKSQPLTLIASLSHNDMNVTDGSCQYYFDNGVATNTLTTFIRNFEVRQNAIISTTVQYLPDGPVEDQVEVPHLETIRIYGLRSKVTGAFVTFPNNPEDKYKHRKELQFKQYEEDLTGHSVLEIYLDEPADADFEVHWNDEITGRRVDCFPDHQYNNLTEQDCYSRQCHYQVSYNDAPWCYYPEDYHTYAASGGIFDPSTGELEGIDLHLNMDKFAGAFDQSIVVPDLEVYPEPVTNSVFRLRIRPKTGNYYTTPEQYALNQANLQDTNNYERLYSFNIDVRENKFNYYVRRRETDEIIWDSTMTPLFFEEQYVSFGTKLPTSDVYGLAEDIHAHLKLDVNYAKNTLFTRFRENQAGDKHTFGSVPFYMAFEKSNLAHGVYFQNNNAMDVEAHPAPGLVFRSTGGIIDLYFFLGPSPAEVLKDFSDGIGRPEMPPYWAYGYQLGKDFNNIDEVENMFFKNVNDTGLPVEAMVFGHTIGDNYRDFTLDENNFASLPEFVDMLRQTYGLRAVLSYQSGISQENDYEPYQRLVSDASYVRGFFGRQYDNNAAINTVIFPDYHDPATQTWWMNEMYYFFSFILKADSAHLILSQPGSFESEDPNDVTYHQCFISNSEDGQLWNYPYYNPFIGGRRQSHHTPEEDAIFHNTICMDRTQWNPETKQQELIYNMHNLYVVPQMDATNKALEAVLQGERPFTTTDTITVPNQRNGAFFNTYTENSWHGLENSIVEILHASMQGYGMVGGDICGYNGDQEITDDHRLLCLRWHQLAAFTPISRNYNQAEGTSDPYSFGQKFVDDVSDWIQKKYQLSPEMHTLMHRYVTRGVPVIRPLWYEFPEDVNARNVNDQFMFGDSMMVAPVVRRDNTVEVYAPGTAEDIWYDAYEHVPHYGGQTYIYAENNTVPESQIPIFFKQGSIVTTATNPIAVAQDVALSVMRFHEGEKQPLIFLNQKTGTARGEQYWDDGRTTTSEYVELEFNARPGSSVCSYVVDNKLRTDFSFYNSENPGISYNIDRYWIYGFDTVNCDVSATEVHSARVKFEDQSMADLELVEKDIYYAGYNGLQFRLPESVDLVRHNFVLEITLAEK